MIESILFMVAALVYLVTGWLVIARVPRNAVGWILAATGGLLAIAAWTEYEFIENLWLPAPVAIALPLVFPDGRPFWRWVAWTGGAGLVLGTLDVLDLVNTLLLTVAAIGAAVSVIVRLRRSRGVERQQVKWFAYVAGLFVIALIFATAAELGGIFDVIGPLAGLVMLLLIGFGIPIATGFAVLRYRLYEIDVVIKRTLVYSTLTVTLAVAYLASVLLLQLVLSPSSDLAIAGIHARRRGAVPAGPRPHPITRGPALLPQLIRRRADRRGVRRAVATRGVAGGVGSRVAWRRVGDDASCARLVVGAPMTRLAWGLAALAIAAVIAGPVVVIAAGVTVGTAIGYGAGIGLVFSVCFPVMGALIVRRRGSHAVGWLLCFIGVTIALHTFVDIWSRTALIWQPGSLPGGVFLSWVAIWLWIPGWFAVTTLLPAMFPDGGRRRLAALGAAVIAAITITNAVLAWPLRGIIDRPVIADPDLAARFDELNAVYLPEVAIVAALTVASFGSLIVRYRRSSADVRRQIAWVMYGFAVAVVLSVIGANRNVGNWVQMLEAVALVGGLAIAMFRYNLYDIGLVVKRTLVYGTLTATLAVAYLASVLLLQLILSPSSDLAIAASTLAVAALFQPARSRIQTIVDRRFYRRAYDVQRTVDSFAARLRHEVTLDGLDAELRAVVRETLQPAHVSLWVRP